MNEQSLGDLVHKLRTEKGMSQYDLSKQAHISQSVLSRLENGYRGTMLSQLIAIAKVFGMTASEMLAKIGH